MIWMVLLEITAMLYGNKNVLTRFLSNCAENPDPASDRQTDKPGECPLKTKLYLTESENILEKYLNQKSFRRFV